MQLNDTTTATLFGIQQDIYFLGKCNVNSFVQGDLNRIINKYYGRLQEVVRAVNENFYLAIATTDLVIGDGSYTYPDGTGTAPAYEKLKSIWAAFTPANIASPLITEYSRVDIIDPDSISNPGYTFTSDAPKAALFGLYFNLQPLVTDATKFPVTDGVKVYYIAAQNKLVLDTDIPKIFSSFHDAITEGALIDVCHRLGDDEASADYEKKFEKRLKDIEAFASNHMPPELSVIEGQDNQGGWSYPWGNTSMA